MNFKINTSHSIEFLIFFIIIFSSTSIIDNSKIEEDEIQYEIDNISGNITLSTRNAMNALGLDSSAKTGAIAQINLTVNSVESEGCTSCINNPIGFEIYGKIDITNIRNQIGGLGRAEGELKIIYLKEYVNTNFISKEWFEIEWNASGGKELDTFTKITIVHEPPLWELMDRYDASFLKINDEEIKSRTGPWLLAEILSDQEMNIQGCLPDSISCEKSFSPDINLTSNYKISQTPKKIKYDFEIHKIEIYNSTTNAPTKNENIRKIFSIKNESEIYHLWCDENNSDDLVAIKSWEIYPNNNKIISPMNLWFKILGFSSTSLFLIDGYWTEIEYPNSGCASFTDKRGILKFNIIKR